MSTKWLTVNSSPKSHDSKKRNWRKAMLVLLSSTLLFTSACSLLPKEEEEEVLPTITPPTVSKKPEYEVTRNTLETKVSSTGKLMSEQEETLSFTVDGLRIKEVKVKNGDNVKAGQVIASLDVEKLQKELRNQRLQLRLEEAKMKETLRKKDEMDPIDFEQTQVAYQEKLQSIADAEKEIAKGTLVAPFDGTVVSVSAVKGANSKAYDPIAIVADTSRLTIAVQMSKDDQKRISIGMEANVSINNVDGVVKGKVKALPVSSPDGNNNGNPLPGQTPTDKLENYVIIGVDKLPKGLNRGQMLSVSIVTQRKKDAIVIPVSALRTIGSRTYVQVVDEKGKREVDIEIGQQTSTEIEVLQGLQPGQKVVGR
ncbi:efflux RND transporter periplasmic adaptor subunit [Paenibacillus taiwanensis]|uniref:efflux RND transporter periplasmic adaptor subunit n=1 Tax=Paenibacillus taiwanensis TaxID=401638 RepID=UPI0003FA5C54|nr:efflux RND transporter periplasmic adaptor subunit [Paenibacillus taiwanensis]